MIFDTDNSPFKNFENKQFNIEIWLNDWYPLICQFLELKSEDDSKALARVLEITQSNSPSYGLKKIIENKRVIAIAPGIHLEKELETYLTEHQKESDILISADGATSYLNSVGVLPHIIVTDFDGNIEAQLLAQKNETILLIHIHGDNFQTIQKHIESISEGNFIITTQTTPLPGSYNFYGFTDGDRIVSLATLMNAEEITLIGYDFGTSIGKYSKNGEIDENRKNRKLKKFTIGKSIINWCYNSGQKIELISEY